MAKRTVEAAEKATQKASKGVELAETGNDEIREVELLTELKKVAVAEARTILAAAEHELKYTQIRALARASWSSAIGISAILPRRACRS